MKEEEEYKYKKKEERYQEVNELPIERNPKEINQEVRAELEEQLQELEVVRKRYYAKYKFRSRIAIGAGILFVLIILGSILQLQLELEFVDMFQFIKIIGVVFWVGIGFQFWGLKVEKEYKHHFKYTVLERVVDLFFSDLRYTPKRSILEEDFKKSRIDQTFKHPYKKYKGEDYFEGTYRGYPISFSEAATTFTKKTVKGKQGETITTYEKAPLFSGLFFMLEMPENASLGSFWGIVPYLKEGELLDSLEMDEQYMQQLVLGQSAKPTSPQFRYKLFENSIPLNASLLKQLTIVSQKMKEPIWVSYEDNRLYIGVSTTFKNNQRIYELFEREGLIKGSLKMQKIKADVLHLFSPPALKTSVLENKEVILKPIDEIQSCLDIVDEVLILFNQAQRLGD